MPTTEPFLPFTGRSPRSRHASYLGARTGAVKAPSQARRMLTAYLSEGWLTDSAMAAILGLPEARISARRSGLIAKGWVQYEDFVPGTHTTWVCRWGLTRAGEAVARSLAA